MRKLTSLIFPVILLFSFSSISLLNSNVLSELNSEKSGKVENQSFMQNQEFYPKLQAYVATLELEFDQIPDERKAQLEEISQYISEKVKAKDDVKITVICTHNSRRSHIGQLWLWAASEFYGVENFSTYSGGTEATAFFPSAVKAMHDAGFSIDKMDDSVNPVYEASLGEGSERLRLFSKKYDDEVNPSEGFAAVMVCTSADEACPFVPGADGRFAIPFRDPKEFDGTPKQAEAYAERCRQIAREMFFVVRMASRGN